MINEVTSSCMYVLEGDYFFLEASQYYSDAQIDTRTETLIQQKRDKNVLIGRFSTSTLPDENFIIDRRNTKNFIEPNYYENNPELSSFPGDATYENEDLVPQLDSSLDHSLLLVNETKETAVNIRQTSKLRRREVFGCDNSVVEKFPHLVAKRNARERKRVQTVNTAFAGLRKVLPLIQGRSKRVSKVRILQEAINYIDQLKMILDEEDSTFIIQRESKSHVQEIIRKRPEAQNQRSLCDE